MEKTTVNVFAGVQRVNDAAEAMRCDGDCANYDKGCTIREQNHPVYCFYKKRRKEKAT